MSTGMVPHLYLRDGSKLRIPPVGGLIWSKNFSLYLPPITPVEQIRVLAGFNYSAVVGEVALRLFGSNTHVTEA
jgi:hypothetical protein